MTSREHCARPRRPEYRQQVEEALSRIQVVIEDGIAPAMKHKWILLVFCGLMLVSLTNCNPAIFSPPSASVTRLPGTPAVKPQTLSPAATEPVELNPSVPITIPLEAALQQVVTQAKEDLARRLEVSVDSVTVDAVVGQEFSTDAFYCRTSKDRIARDELPLARSGHSILLSALARRYEYHASGPTVIFCRPLP